MKCSWANQLLISMWVALEVGNKVFDIGFYLVNKDSSPHESVHLPKVVDCFLNDLLWYCPIIFRWKREKHLSKWTIITTLSMFESLTFLKILAMMHLSKDNFVLKAFFQLFTNKLKQMWRLWRQFNFFKQCVNNNRWTQLLYSNSCTFGLHIFPIILMLNSFLYVNMSFCCWMLIILFLSKTMAFGS